MLRSAFNLHVKECCPETEDQTGQSVLQSDYNILQTQLWANVTDKIIAQQNKNIGNSKCKSVIITCNDGGSLQRAEKY